MKINSFDRASLKTLNKAIIEAVQPIAEEFGIQIKLGGARFTPTDGKVKLICAIQNSDGTYETPERADFKEFALMYGLTADDIDMEFEWSKEKFKLTGIKIRSRRFPIMAQRMRDGKSFKFGADIVKFAKAQQNNDE